MSLRAKLLIAILGIGVAAIIAVGLVIPSIIANQIREFDRQDDRFSLEGVRVSPFLRVHVERVHLTTDFIEGSCTNLQATPAYVRSLSSPTIASLELERCATVEAPAATATSAIQETQGQRADVLINRLVEELSYVLRKIGDRADNIEVASWAHSHRIKGHDLHINLHKLKFDEPFFGDRHLTFDIATTGYIDIPNASVQMSGYGRDFRVSGILHDAVTFEGKSLRMESAELQHASTLTLKGIEVRSLHPTLQRLTLEEVVLNLGDSWRLDIRNGRAEISQEIASADLSPARRALDEEERRARRRRLLDESTPPPPEDLLSMQMLTRARDAVKSLDEMWFTIERRLKELPIEILATDLQLVRNDIVLASLDEMLLRPDASIEGDFSIGQARFSIATQPQSSRRWALEAADARLSRLAAILGLQEHVEGTLNADIQVSLEDGILQFEGPFRMENVRLNHAAVSPKALEGMNLQGDVSLTLPAWKDAAVQFNAKALFNTIPIEASLSMVPYLDRARIQAKFRVSEPTPCRRIWQAVPAGLVPDLGKSGVRFSGEAEPSLSISYVPGHFNTFELSADGFPGTCTIQISSGRYNPAQLLSNRYVHHVVEGVTSDNIFVGPGTADYVRVSHLPAYIPAVMYLSEEINFPNNKGISIGLINKAIRYSLPRERFAYGGSTVTQQLVKNLFFTREKYLARKFQEAIVVWAVESELTKDRIIELYMNCIEFGPDIYGIVRAARHYFAKSPAELTPVEAAWLAGLKPSPGRGRRDWQRGHSDFNNWNSERIRELLFRLNKFGGFLPLSAMDEAWPYVVTFPTSPNAGAWPANFDERLRPVSAASAPTTLPEADSEIIPTNVTGDDTEQAAPLIQGLDN